MSGRHATELRFRFQGDPALAKAYISEARKYVASVGQQRQGIGEGASLSRKLTNADGVVFRVLWSGSQPIVEIDVRGIAGGAMEEVIYLYISSAGGLRIFDLGEKRLVKTITGLHDYEVDNVSPDGKIVHMTGASVAVRVDIPALSAFGYVDYPDYWWDVSQDPDAYTLGRAVPVAAVVSPDQTRVVNLYSNTVDPATYAIKTGNGGAMVQNADTLAPVRMPIRATEADPSERTGVAWAPDSQRFFTVLAVASDTEYPPHDPSVSEIGNEYVGAFSRDGELLGSVLIQTRFAAGGFFALVYSPICSPDGTRLYVYARPDFGTGETRVYTLDITAAAPVILGHTVLPYQARTGAVYPSGVSHSGKYLVRASPNVDGVGADGIVVITVRDDDGNDVFDQVETFANSAAYNALNGAHDCIKGPKSSVGQPHDTRWFGLTSAKRFQGFKSFDGDPMYDFDLTAYSVKSRYALVNVGTRQKRNAA